MRADSLSILKLKATGVSRNDGTSQYIKHRSLRYRFYHGQAVKIRRTLEFSGLVGKIFLNHERNLEGYRVVKLTKVKAGELSDLLKTVYKSVSMYEELS